MELIKGITQKIKVSLPSSVTSAIAQVVSQDGTEVGPAIDPEITNGLCTITVPYSVVVEEGTYKVLVVFLVEGQQYTRTIHFNVATPYLELWQLKEILDDADDEECWLVESAVRNIINAHTGQSFGYSKKTLKLVADAGIALPLPERIIKLDKLSEGDQVRFDRTVTHHQDTFLGDGQFVITGDGWFLKKPAWSSRTWNSPSISANPIVAPRRNRQYINDVEYALTGTFGYEQVPSGVIEAAKLLVNDYACGEQLYRDRFLQSVKASDWNLTFYSAAYYRTGNARANLLLSPYVMHGMAVI